MDSETFDNYKKRQAKRRASPMPARAQRERELIAEQETLVGGMAYSTNVQLDQLGEEIKALKAEVGQL